MPRTILKNVYVAIALLLVGGSAYGFVASSTNYVLQSDSMNFGGLQSSSDGYRLEDTFGEIGAGYSSSTAYQLNAGYQQQGSSTISISAGPNVTMGTITGKAGDTSGSRVADGATSFWVRTDSPTGYSLYVKSGTSPAYSSGGGSFSDFAPNNAAWSVGAKESMFGFSPSGLDAVPGYSGNWFGFSSKDFVIAKSADPNSLSGATTSVSLKAEAGIDVAQPYGSYSAQIVATAIAN